MTEQTSRLAIVIDSTGAERQADNLATALGKMAQAGQQAAGSADKVTKAAEQEKSALSDLLGKIDPVSAALSKLDKQQQDLAKARDKGLVDTDTFDLYSKKIDAARNGLAGLNQGMKDGTITANRYKQAISQLPNLFTDIFTQQGGLEAGSFGGLSILLEILKSELSGISDATDESSGSLSDNANALGDNAENAKKLTGLLVPTRLAITGVAAAVGVLTYAYFQGLKEQDAFNESLILTGNIVGKTSGQLAYMATAIADNAGTTISMSSDVLNQLVAGGKVAASTLASASEAIIKLNDATGISTSQLVSDFEAIAGSPVEAIGKLNDQYHFLTLATYNQIRALQEEGNQQEAAKVASDAYSAAISQKADDIKASLGTLQTAWNDLGDAAKWAWDQMLDIGRESSLEQRLGTLEETLADAKAKQKEGGLWNRFSANASGYNIPEMEKQVAALKSQITAQNVINDIHTSHLKKQQDGIEAQKRLDAQSARTASNEKKRLKELAQLERDIAAVRASGGVVNDEAQRRKEINDKYKDPKTPKGKAYTEDAATRLLDQLNQQTVALQSQLVVDDKLSSVTQQRIKFEQQIADIKTKKQLTADQKSILSRSDEILQAYKAQEALGNQVKTLDDYRKMQLTVNNNDKAANNLLIERLKLLDKAKVAGATDTQGTREKLLRTAPNKPPSAVTNVTGGLTPKDGSLSGSWGGMQQQMQQLQQAQQALDLWQQQSLQSYQAYYQGRVDLTAEYEQQIANVKQQHTQQSEAIEAQRGVIITSATQSMMDSTVSIMKDGFSEQSAAYKVAFAASKAFAIAQAIININGAIAKAANFSMFPANLIAMATVAANTASIVSSIQSVSSAGFMSGGYTGNMATNAVAGVVHGKEFVFDAAATKKIGVSNLEALRNGKPLDATLGKSGFGTGAQNVSNSSQKTVNNFNVNTPPVTINGNPSDATIQLVQQATQAGAERGYKRVVNDIATGRGEAHKALVGGYNTSRRTG